MREIIFRGKRTDTDEWVYGNLIDYRDGQFAITIQHHVPTYVSVDPETVGQYTGLKDKTGNRIFEKDIIKAWQWILDEDFELVRDHSKYDIAVVKWDDELLGWGVESKLENTRTDMLAHLAEVEVIGNIFDNPEYENDDSLKSIRRTYER